MSEAGKRALFIGASRGLGLGLVKQHLERGWQVTATERTRSKGLAALKCDRLVVEMVDITDAGSAAALAGRLAGQRFDLLFINAGVSSADKQAPIHTVADEEVVRVLMTNAIAPLRLAERLHDLVAPRGTIAFMTSILGSVSLNTEGGWELYRASKAALNTLTRSYRKRHGDEHTVLSVHPGWVRTDMGGEGAPLDVETSTRGITDMLEKRAGSGGHHYVDYRNQELPW